MRGSLTVFPYRDFHPISSRPCQAHTFASVDAPTALLFHIERYGRRATERHVGQKTETFRNVIVLAMKA